MPLHSKAGSGPSPIPVGLTYAPALLHELQSTLATLADLDCAFDLDIEVVRDSRIPKSLKEAAVEGLQKQHQQRRASYVRQLTALQERITALSTCGDSAPGR